MMKTKTTREQRAGALHDIGSGESLCSVLDGLAPTDSADDEWTRQMLVIERLIHDADLAEQAIARAEAAEADVQALKSTLATNVEELDRQRGRAEAAEAERDAALYEADVWRKRANRLDGELQRLLMLRRISHAAGNPVPTEPPRQIGVINHASNTSCNVCGHPLTYSTDSDGYSWESCSRCGYQSIPAKRSDAAG